MKITKKIASMLLMAVLLVPGISGRVYAASGISFFTDLETTVGATFTVTGTVVTREDIVGDATIELEYDEAYVRFVSGEGVEDQGGKLVFKGSGNGTDDRFTFDMEFQALQEGETRMEQVGAEVFTSSGEEVPMEMGYSAITIGEGDPSLIQEPAPEGATVEIHGLSYTLSGSFDESAMPVGFTASEFEYEGETYACAAHEEAGITAAYLVDETGAGSFWLYNEKDASFDKYEEIMISETTSIIILDGREEITMPKTYVESTIMINDTEFPVWVDNSREGVYIFYALNSNGEKALYSYDSVESTYQKMAMPTMAMSDENADETVSVVDKFIAFAEAYLMFILAGGICLIIVLIILSITLFVKLRHRNLELDDLYDEYGIDMDDKEEVKAKKEPAKKEKKEKKGIFKKKKEEVVDEYEEEYEKDFGDDTYYDDYFEEDYETNDASYPEDTYEESYTEVFTDNFLEEDLVEELADDLADLRRDYEQPQQNHSYDSYYSDEDFEDFDFESEKSPRFSDDTFKMDFIDL